MFWYHALRGLARSLAFDLSSNRSQVHRTSRAVKGLPSCQATSRRSEKVSCVPSSFHDQLVARSGTIVCILFCGSSRLLRTRLLQAPLIGISVEFVASSKNDMVARLSRC